MYSKNELIEIISELRCSLNEYQFKLLRLKDDLNCGSYYDYDDQLSAIEHCESIIYDIEHEISSLEDELENIQTDSFDDDEVFF